MTSKKFVKLERHVEHEYEEKGYGRKRAEYIGKAVAGKIARAKKKKLVKV
jgi:hypothetical protein